jgi:hypothetical protein
MDAIVEALWARLFPSLTTAVREGEGRAAVTQIAGDILLTWRSSMGKEGIRIVTHFLKSEYAPNEEEAQELASYYLEDYRFVYANPDDDDEKGAFQSFFVSLALAAHLKMTIGNVHLDDAGYGYPVGALAIAAAVIERALKLVSAGHVNVWHEGAEKAATTSEGVAGKKRKVKGYEGYTDAAWGDITRSWVGAARRLNAEKWRMVLSAAVSNVDFSNMDETQEVGDNDPRAMIDI